MYCFQVTYRQSFQKCQRLDVFSLVKVISDNKHKRKTIKVVVLEMKLRFM